MRRRRPRIRPNLSNQEISIMANDPKENTAGPQTVEPNAAGAGPSTPGQPTAAKASPTGGKAVRDAKGKLTRHGMEEAIRNGGSVIHNGVVVSRLDQLPSEAELAQGDTAAENAALSSLDDRQAALDRERALITSRRTPAKK
jgi:hypothetical protein